MQTSAWPRLGRDFKSKNCNVHSPKAFETLNTKMLQILFSLLCVKYIFFWCYGSVRFKAKERVRTYKDYIISREITIILKIAAGQGNS